MDLTDLDPLFIDCQTTGATPAQGHLLELGWQRGEAVQAHLIALPDEATIPPQVTRVTGIQAEDLVAARPVGEVWAELCAAVNGPTVIHFAQFERRWLNHLADTLGPPPRPLSILCTHQIAQRLLPDLPRRGLRAVAGYYGFPAGSVRRAADHVAATAWVWRHQVAALADAGVRTLTELETWLATKPPKRGKRAFPMPRAVRLGLPESPGVYHLLRSNGDVLYVGKARSLRKRVNSHFQKQSNLAEHRLELLSQVRDVATFPCASPLEAALLEVRDIKRLDPPYNQALVAGDRQVVFASRDLLRFSERPSQQFPIGPLPSPFAVGAVAAILEPGDTPWMATGVGPDRGPPEDVLLAGLAQVRARWPELASRRTLRAIQAQATDLVLPDLDEDTEWTPQLVADAATAQLATVARHLGRAEFLCDLSESVIRWRPRGGDPRALVVQAARIQPGEAELPPGWRTPRRTRQRRFDLVAYDRLRVLMTELRRVAEEDPSAEVVFGPGRRLRGARLVRALAWN